MNRETPGIMKDHTTAIVPFGYLPCAGGSYLVANYPALFNRIRYDYGGSGLNFNVPNMQRRVTVGSGGTAVSSSLPGVTVGSVGGEELHALVDAELGDLLGEHTHSLSGHTHAAGGITANGTNFGANDWRFQVVSSAPWTDDVLLSGVTNSGESNSSSSGIQCIGTSDGPSVNSSGTPVGTSTPDGHNNIQPSFVTLKIIKW